MITAIHLKTSSFNLSGPWSNVQYKTIRLQRTRDLLYKKVLKAYNFDFRAMMRNAVAGKECSSL